MPPALTILVTTLLSPLLAPLLALLLGRSPLPPAAAPDPRRTAPAAAVTAPSPAAPEVPATERGVWPVSDHTVLVGFAPPSTVWGAGHRGVDLGAVPGEQVRSALRGTVTFAGRIAGRGVVVVSHGSRRTTYEPVQASVRVGQPVATGAVIGVLGPGTHCAPSSCLHWGLRRGDTYLDPLSLLGGTRIRLLPLP